MAKSDRGDGLAPLGMRNGKRWWEARITYVDPRTGKRGDARNGG